MQKVFFGGLPTDLDVKKLIEVIGIPEESTVISYEKIGDVIGELPRTNRYMAITTAWRKKLFREHNVLMDTRRGEGFYRATPKDRVSVASDKAHMGKRAIIRASTIAGTTEKTKLDEETRKICDHLSMLPGRLRLAELVSPKALPVE